MVPLTHRRILEHCGLWCGQVVLANFFGREQQNSVAQPLQVPKVPFTVISGHAESFPG